MNEKSHNRIHHIMLCNHMLPTILCSFLLCSSLLCCYAIDTITSNNPITDGIGETLVSAGKRFELGFFSPNESSNGARYVGIWYYMSRPRVVVWVANRDHPLFDRNGSFAIREDGNLKVLDGKGNPYWSTDVGSPSNSRTAMLKDSGNLVLSDDLSTAEFLWDSFHNATDTFLAGMSMDGTVVLTSWKSPDDPASGDFTFQMDQDRVNQFITHNKSKSYWRGGFESGDFISFDQMPYAVAVLLTNCRETSTSSTPGDFYYYINKSCLPVANTRLVMNFTGEIQYLSWNDAAGYSSLIWNEPRDQCSVLNACGNFGSCNLDNELLQMCKCLPGFEPALPDMWNSGDFSGGCTRKSQICSKKGDDTFLSLEMMKVGKPDTLYDQATNETECREECGRNCNCQAYLYSEARRDQRRGRGTGTSCWIWTEDLSDLQEEYAGGIDFYVRVVASDIESTVRNCETCGTNIIPYPLSTGPNCGDPMYFSFHCNISTGQVSFEAPNGSYRVTSIDPNALKFVIQAKDEGNCKAGNSTSKILQLNQSLPFQVNNWSCNADSGNLRGDEFELSWDSPPEPTCASSSDCKDWPDSTCQISTRDGKKRCLCNTNSQWNSSSLNCTREDGYGAQSIGPSASRRMSRPLIIAVPVTIAIVLIALSCIIYKHRRKVANIQENRDNIQRNRAHHLDHSEGLAQELIDFEQLTEEDKAGIDVPFFDLESILVATDNFSDANKLGKGGFGPVYKGRFLGGREIAVKRLSSVSVQGLEEFKNEVMLIAKLQHRNLVRLLGYCVKGEEKILLYEYMPNKSLDSFIFDRTLCMALDWELRFNIILGIARGLLYLHQDSRLRIIHRDLKTSNILLDEEMNPKISDFGLARIFGGKQTEATTNRVVGTFGYMSPEYALDGFFSIKSDVFSFGVVVLEIISGKRNTGFYQSEQALNLLGHAWRLWNEDNALGLMDETLCNTCNESEFLKCISVGLLCVQEDPNDRPTMSNVIVMLGSETATLPTPKQPAFILRRGPPIRAAPNIFSNNDLTITVEQGR